MATHPQHTQWTGLKTKHAQAIKAKGIKFDKDLGPTLREFLTVLRASLGANLR